MDKASAVSDFRVVMIGKNQEEKAKLGTFLTAKSIVPYGKLSKQSSVFSGEWRNAAVKVYNTSDLFSADDAKATEEVQRLISVCDPGPNAFLLLVDPSDFSKINRDELRSILQRFGDDALKSSMMIVTKSEAVWVPAVHILKQDCANRCTTLNFAELSTSVLRDLMESIENIIIDNQDLYGAGPEPIYQDLLNEPPLNIMLYGPYANWKATAASVILKQRISSANSTKSVEHKGQVSGRTVSIVELPALSSLKPDAARREALQCLSLCEPQGVHAFVLVQPVGPLNPEDKLELDAIRRAFTTKMNAFKMILFPVDSESGALAVSNFIRNSKDVQELCKSCDNRYVILNISDKQRVPDVMAMVVNISQNGSKSFTKQMTTKPQVKRRTTFLNLSRVPTPAIEVKRHSVKKESLRIVLIGKTGSGKSATANTILGQPVFESKVCQNAVTKLCKKVVGRVEGKSLVIVDTPGLFDTDLSNDQVQEELVKCINMLAPGPHVFLLVLQIGRFTKEEQETVKLIKEFFGNAAENYMIVVFTKGDDLENTSMESFLRDGNSQVRALLEECGNRYHVLNNKARQNRKQVQELLRLIEKTVQKNGGGFYSSAMFEQAEKAIEKEKVKILKEKEPMMKKQEKDIEEKHNEKIKVTKSKILELKAKIEQEITLTEKQVQEKHGRLEKEEENRRKYEQRRKEEERLKKEEDELQIQEWNNRYKNLVTQINTKPDSVSNRSSLMSLQDDLKREQDEWEKKRHEWWTKRMEEEEKYREEESKRLSVLEREYADAKMLFDLKKKEDELRRREEEREIRAMQENHQRQLEEIRLQNEEEARRQAEELNDFRRTYAKEREELREKRKCADEYMLKHINRSRTNRRDFQSLTLRHKQEMERLEQLQDGYDTEFLSKEVAALRRQHEEEVHEWIEEKVSAMSDSACAIL